MYRIDRPEGTIVILKDNFETEKEFWEFVTDMMSSLTKLDYVVLFRYEDCGVYAMEYGYDRCNPYGAAEPHWITPDIDEDYDDEAIIN